MFYLDLVWRVILGLPIRNPPHPALSIPELLAERSVLRLGVTAAMGIMKSHVKEERRLLVCLPSPLPLALEELPNEKFDLGDISTHLQHGIGLLRVGEVEWVYGSRPDVFLPDDTFPKKCTFYEYTFRLFLNSSTDLHRTCADVGFF